MIEGDMLQLYLFLNAVLTLFNFTMVWILIFNKRWDANSIKSEKEVVKK